MISDEEFQSFILRHANVKCLVPESNEKVCVIQFLDHHSNGGDLCTRVLAFAISKYLSTTFISIYLCEEFSEEEDICGLERLLIGQRRLNIHY